MGKERMQSKILASHVNGGAPAGVLEGGDLGGEWSIEFDGTGADEASGGTGVGRCWKSKW